jgi:hypothetical protein
MRLYLATTMHGTLMTTANVSVAITNQPRVQASVHNSTTM